MCGCRCAPTGGTQGAEGGMGVAKEELCGDVRLWVREAWELRKEVDSFARSKRITYTAAQSLEGIACNAELGRRLGYGQMESAQVTISWSRTRPATPGFYLSIPVGFAARKKSMLGMPHAFTCVCTYAPLQARAHTLTAAAAPLSSGGDANFARWEGTSAPWRAANSQHDPFPRFRHSSPLCPV